MVWIEVWFELNVFNSNSNFKQTPTNNKLIWSGNSIKKGRVSRKWSWFCFLRKASLRAIHSCGVSLSHCGANAESKSKWCRICFPAFLSSANLNFWLLFNFTSVFFILQKFYLMRLSWVKLAALETRHRFQLIKPLKRKREQPTAEAAINWVWFHPSRAKLLFFLPSI